MNTRELDQKTIEVLGRQMSYAEIGTGTPIVFQHGNPHVLLPVAKYHATAIRCRSLHRH